MELLGRYTIAEVTEAAVTWHQPREDQYRDACRPVRDSAGYLPPANKACGKTVWAVRSKGQIALVEATPAGFESVLLTHKSPWGGPCEKRISVAQAAKGLLNGTFCRAVEGDVSTAPLQSYYYATSGDLKDPYGRSEAIAIFLGGLVAFPIGQDSVFKLEAAAGPKPSEIRIEERTQTILFVTVKTIHRYSLKRVADY